jgi:hypothetical protein
MPRRMPDMRRVLIGSLYFVAGIMGMVLALVGAHCWEDHKALHVLIQIEAQRQQAAQKLAAPAPAEPAK